MIFLAGVRCSIILIIVFVILVAFVSGASALFDWLKGDAATPEAEPAPVSAPPTPEEIAGSLAKVDQLAVDGKVPPAVLTRVYRVTRKLRETLPK